MSSGTRSEQEAPSWNCALITPLTVRMSAPLSVITALPPTSEMNGCRAAKLAIPNPLRSMTSVPPAPGVKLMMVSCRSRDGTRRCRRHGCRPPTCHCRHRRRGCCCCRWPPHSRCPPPNSCCCCRRPDPVVAVPAIEEIAGAVGKQASLPSCPSSVLALPLAPIHTSSPAPPANALLVPLTPIQSLPSLP